MVPLVRNPSFLPSCILAGVALMFVVLATALPLEQVVGMIGGSAVVVGLVVARTRRHALGGEYARRTGVRG